MSLTLLGTLPISALQLGVAAALPGIEKEIEDLTTQAGTLQKNLEFAKSFIPPDIASLVPALTTAPASIGELVNPANYITGGVTQNLDLAKQLGLIEANLALVGTISATLSAGADAGSLAAWAYAGRAAGFGLQLTDSTKAGWSGVDGSAPVQGLVIMTSSFESWGQLSLSFNTAETSLHETSSDAAKLTFLGVLSGGQVNTGVLTATLPIDLYKKQLQGLVATITGQIQVSLGVNLPSVDVLLPSLKLAIKNPLDLITNMATFSLVPTLTASIGAIQGGIKRLELQMGELDLMLSGGGLTVWSYSGPANGLGPSLRDATVSGLPNAGDAATPAYGLAIACGVPSAWAGFGKITLTG